MRRNSPGPATVTLYRPVGKKELDRIRASGFREFSKDESQPIVVEESYAIQIARDWNTKDARCDFAGYVTRFQLREDWIAGYPVQTVGPARQHEYWIPPEDTDELNAALLGPIEVTHAFRGETTRA